MFLALLLQARNQGGLPNQARVRKLPDGDWLSLSSFIPSMRVMDDEGSETVRSGGGFRYAALGPQEYWSRVIAGWYSFRGRASKSDVWRYSLAIWMGLALIPLAKDLLVPSAGVYLEVMECLVLYVLLPLAAIPVAATLVRRLHDVGHSGMGGFLLLVLRREQDRP